MEYYVYVLISMRDMIRYVGSGENPLERLRRHNKGDYKFTKGHRPWRLIYQETCKSRAEAMRREKFLKSGQGRNFLDRILGKPAGSSNGRTSAFEAEYPGSSPGPAGLPRKDS